MKITFCDLCNESVPESDLDQGVAKRRGDRVICANCEAAMSHELASDEDDGDSRKTDEKVGAAGVVAASVEETSAADDTTIVDAVPAGLRMPATVAVRPTSSAGAAVGVALASVALLMAVGATAFLFDRIEKLHVQMLGAVEQNRVATQGLAGTIEERLTRDLRMTTTELSEAQGEIRELRGRLEDMGTHNRDTLAAIRGDIQRVEARMGDLDTVISKVGRHEEELSKVALTAASLHAEVLRVGDRLNTVEIPEQRFLDDSMIAEEEQPEWIGLADDLTSQNSGTRWQAVQSLGATRDPAVAEYLTPMLKDPDIFVRMATARILGDLGAVIGIPTLIDALEDPEASVREDSVVSLRSITGRDFRFDPGAKEAERAKRVKAWRDWWKKAAEELLGEK